jgi:hypothetical protein
MQKLVRLLLDRGASPNELYDGRTPFIRLVRWLAGRTDCPEGDDDKQDRGYSGKFCHLEETWMTILDMFICHGAYAFRQRWFATPPGRIRTGTVTILGSAGILTRNYACSDAQQRRLDNTARQYGATGGIRARLWHQCQIVRAACAALAVCFIHYARGIGAIIVFFLSPLFMGISSIMVMIILHLPTFGGVKASTYELDPLRLPTPWGGVGTNLKLLEGCRLLWEIGVLAAFMEPRRPLLGPLYSPAPNPGPGVTLDLHGIGLKYWCTILILFRRAIPIVSSARRVLLYASIVVGPHIVPVCILLVLRFTEDSVRTEWP